MRNEPILFRSTGPPNPRLLYRSNLAISRLPSTNPSGSVSVPSVAQLSPLSSPFLFTKQHPTDQYFNFNNVTNCSDGTICPNSNNQSCCAARKGVELISYHNTAIIPTPTDDLSAYYFNAGYSIPVTASAHSSSASNSLSMTITGATSASVKTLQTSTSSSSSSGLSKGASAGTGVGAALGVLIVGAAVILFIYKRKRKSGVAEKHLPATMIVRG